MSYFVVLTGVPDWLQIAAAYGTAFGVVVGTATQTSGRNAFEDEPELFGRDALLLYSMTR